MTEIAPPGEQPLTAPFEICRRRNPGSPPDKSIRSSRVPELRFFLTGIAGRYIQPDCGGCGLRQGVP